MECSVYMRVQNVTENRILLMLRNYFISSNPQTSTTCLYLNVRFFCTGVKYLYSHVYQVLGQSTCWHFDQNVKILWREKNKMECNDFSVLFSCAFFTFIKFFLEYFILFLIPTTLFLFKFLLNLGFSTRLVLMVTVTLIHVLDKWLIQRSPDGVQYQNFQRRKWNVLLNMRK